LEPGNDEAKYVYATHTGRNAVPICSATKALFNQRNIGFVPFTIQLLSDPSRRDEFQYGGDCRK
jgi:hypothetical protein